MSEGSEKIAFQRLAPLAVLNPNSQKPFERHNIVEKLIRPSPYLPTMGLECEFVLDRYSRGYMPWRKFREANFAGIKTGHDGELSSYKTELKLAVNNGTHLVHAHELSILKNMGILHLRKKRDNYMTEFYPIHLNIGIPSDVPDTGGANDPDEYLGLYEWAELRKDADSPIIPDVLGYSDTFLLARIFDATGWATSANRLKMPFEVYEDAGVMAGFMAQGASGVETKHPNITDLEEPVTEIRTLEIWGAESLINFQKYLRTIQHIGASLKSYSKLPMHLRDQILQAQLRNDSEIPLEIIMNYDGFDLPEDANLAYLWHELRLKSLEIFQKYELPHPMKEYNRKEFLQFAKHLPTIGKRRSQLKMMSEMRSLLTSYRGKIVNLV